MQPGQYKREKEDDSGKRGLGAEVFLVRNDRISPPEIASLGKEGGLRGIVLSPGPKSPDEAGVSIDAVRRFGGEVPVLGACLGHQAIARAYGGSIVRLPRPMHGRISTRLPRGIWGGSRFWDCSPTS